MASRQRAVQAIGADRHGLQEMADIGMEEHQRDIAGLILDEDAIKGELAKRGLETTGGQAVVLAQLIKANQGDTDAAKFVRDTAGEKPREGIEIGNLDGKPLESIDLSALTDEQLKALAEARKAE